MLRTWPNTATTVRNWTGSKRPFLIAPETGRTYIYEDLDRQAGRLDAFLSAHGVGPGEPVGMLLLGRHLSASGCEIDTDEFHGEGNNGPAIFSGGRCRRRSIASRT